MKHYSYNPYQNFKTFDSVLEKLTGNFIEDFTVFTDWCIEYCRVEENFRKSKGYPLEPYGLTVKKGQAESNTFDLKVYVQNYISASKDKWLWLYNSLQDQESKKTLINVLAYRCLGWRYVPMPMDDLKTWAIMQELDKAAEKTDSKEKFSVGFYKMVLSPFEVDLVDERLNLLATGGCIFSEVLYSQYVYNGKNISFSPKNGDVVIDCGACFGATSLYFASQVGQTGKVYSFEFFPSNIEVFMKNLSKNSWLCERIQLIKSPVWSEANVQMEVRGVGPAAKVSIINFKSRFIRFWKKTFNTVAIFFSTKTKKKYSQSHRFLVDTTSIDCEYKNFSMASVDFIKMDIEGAELSALKGAKDTIIKHKPTLAICVYHRLEDFYEIPEFLSGLNLGYKFYLQHATVHGDETVLFACAQS